MKRHVILLRKLGMEYFENGLMEMVVVGILVQNDEIAKHGNLSMIQWARDCDCLWDIWSCSAAVTSGH